MAFNNQITRSKVQALIPEQVAAGILTKVATQSAVLSLFRHIPVAATQVRIPILAALPTAYWVNGDTGQKQTTEMSWSNKYLNIEELAVIVPIPENVLDDTSFDVWGEVQPLVEEAIGRAFDAAAFFGTNAPSSFPVNIRDAAVAAGNTLAEGATQANGGFLDDVDQAFAMVEEDGYDVSGLIAKLNAKSRFRRQRATTGERLWHGTDAPGNAPALAINDYEGVPVVYPMRGLFPATTRLIAIDRTEFIVGIRRDISWKLLDQAVIQDNAGNILYNLAQQDMVAMRVTFRAGWQVANILNFDNLDDATRYPAAVLTY